MKNIKIKKNLKKFKGKLKKFSRKSKIYFRDLWRNIKDFFKESWIFLRERKYIFTTVLMSVILLFVLLFRIPVIAISREFKLWVDETITESGEFTLIWNDIKLDNYSIYEYIDYINEINDSVELIEDNIKETFFTIEKIKNATYYYIVIGIGKIEDLLSNCIEVNIRIPSEDWIPPGEEPPEEPPTWDYGVPNGTWFLYRGFAEENDVYSWFFWNFSFYGQNDTEYYMSYTEISYSYDMDTILSSSSGTATINKSNRIILEETGALFNLGEVCWLFCNRNLSVGNEFIEYNFHSYVPFRVSTLGSFNVGNFSHIFDNSVFSYNISIADFLGTPIYINMYAVFENEYSNIFLWYIRHFEITPLAMFLHEVYIIETNYEPFIWEEGD